MGGDSYFVHFIAECDFLLICFEASDPNFKQINDFIDTADAHKVDYFLVGLKMEDVLLSNMENEEALEDLMEFPDTLNDNSMGHFFVSALFQLNLELLLNALVHLLITGKKTVK